MLVLGIESSCDETAAAVVRDGREVLSNIVASQHDLHRPFGGVVPEVAARAHAERITAVTDEALRVAGVKSTELGGIAVVNQPGLVGALLVGLSAAKAFALAWDRPYVGVDHLLAHVYAATLAGFDAFPHVSLVASGGHTCLYLTTSPGEVQVLGQTADDAAGEAFDKAAKLLKLGFPGGPLLACCAEKGDPKAVVFPRSNPNQKPGDTLNFSFSGLKTALYYHLRNRTQNGAREISEQERSDVAASFQETVCEIMTEKVLAACRSATCPALAIGGGVACNRRLRAMLTERAGAVRVFFPPPALCADNAAMTAGLGYHYLARGDRADWSLDVDPTPKRAG